MPSDRIMQNSAPEAKFQIVGIDSNNVGHTLQCDTSGNLIVTATFGGSATVTTISGSTTAVTGNVTVVQPTGTNLHTVIDSGAITVTPGGAAPLSLSRNSSAALEASHIIKASPGTFYGVIGYNSKVTAQFVQIFNSATVPVDTTVPIYTIAVAAQSNFSLDLSTFGDFFSAGIVITNSSTAASKTIGSADCFFTNLFI